MVTKQPQFTKESELSRFHLAFEYDKTYAEVRRDVRIRADKTLA